MNLEGDMLTPDEHDELDIEIINHIRKDLTPKTPYIEDVKVANCNLPLWYLDCLTQKQMKLLDQPIGHPPKLFQRHKETADTMSDFPPYTVPSYDAAITTSMKNKILDGILNIYDSQPRRFEHNQEEVNSFEGVFADKDWVRHH